MRERVVCKRERVREGVCVCACACVCVCVCGRESERKCERERAERVVCVWKRDRHRESTGETERVRETRGVDLPHVGELHPLRGVRDEHLPLEHRVTLLIKKRLPSEDPPRTLGIGPR